MRIVVLGGYTENPGDLGWEGLKGSGDPTAYDRTPADKTAERAGDAEAICTNKTPISTQPIKRYPNLKFVGVLATGYNVIDTAVAEAVGVIVSDIPTYGMDIVAQHATVLLLELCHHIREHFDRVKAEEWTHNADWCFWKHPLVELARETFDVIGFRRIGQDTVKAAEALGIKVLTYNEYPNKALETDNYRHASLSEFLAQADVISLYCPLFPSTEGTINKDSIAKMKDGVKIINISRGPLIVEKDLREALDSGKVSDITVNVVSTEPVHEDNSFLDARNMIITPHITWTPKESRQKPMNIAVDNLKYLVNGAPRSVVDKQQESQTACSAGP